MVRLTDGAVLGETLEIDLASELCLTLEYLVPSLLRPQFPEWEWESTDGWIVESVTKTGARTLHRWGGCILIIDQTLTPFRLVLQSTDATTLTSTRIRLGKPGEGALGISGPICTSQQGHAYRAALPARIETIRWAHDAAV